MDRSARKKSHFVALSITFLATGVLGSVVFVTSSIFSNYHINKNEIEIQRSKLQRMNNDYILLTHEKEIIKKREDEARQEYLYEIEGRGSDKDPGFGSIAAHIEKNLRDLENEQKHMCFMVEAASNELKLQTKKCENIQSENLGKQLILSSMFCSLLIIVFFSFRKLLYISWPTWSVYLIYYLPEEIVGELGAFNKQLADDQKITTDIRPILFLKILELIWAFHVQIKIDNLSLPSENRQIND